MCVCVCVCVGVVAFLWGGWVVRLGWVGAEASIAENQESQGINLSSSCSGLASW